MAKRLNLTGKQYGFWTVIGEKAVDVGNRTKKWECRCECGTVRMVSQAVLQKGQSKSCGCARVENLKQTVKTRPRKNDLTGKRFGRLLVEKYIETDKNHHTVWQCKCDCGKTVMVKRTELCSGDTQSCGCYAKERRIEFNKATKTKHGLYGTRIYVVWKDMLRRCEKPYCVAYKHYGGRGIKVCHEWHDLNNFAEWCYENGYDETAEFGECTIERIDVNGDYEPDNCMFTDMFHQNCNRTITVKGEYKGETVALMKLCREEKVDYRKVYNRTKLKNMTYEEAIEEVRMLENAEKRQVG